MSKSKYPSELDSSIEIPAVRDNIVEVGSDVLNSLRSAIFQIERTLGVNPQGAVGNSVADRLNRALDGNGNISKEALSMAGLVSGPISNSDVSSAAAISESKLNLDFPTGLIQQEVLALVGEIDRYIGRLDEIAAILTAHVHLDATNRHRAMAITVDEIGNGSQSVATNFTPSATAQEVFEDIYGSHINYDGSDISSLNKSHSANQVFFDRANVSGDIQSDDTQGAIEETINLANRQLDDHQNIFHQNGAARNIVSTSVSDINDGRTTVDDSDASHSKYSTYDTRNTSVVSFDSPQEMSSYGVEASDIVRVTVGDGETKDMQISSATIVDEKVESVEVFGRLVADSFSGDQAKILKNKNQPSIQTGLLLGVVQFADKTSSGIIQISNPEAAAIVTSGCRPSEISNSNRYFKLTFESGDALTLDLYSSVDPAQTIDTIIREINEQLSEGAHPALAYRLDVEGLSSEIAIVHNIPSNATTAYTLTASRVTDDGIDSVGFAHIDGVEVDSQPDNEYFIQGSAYSGLGEKINSEVPVITDLTSSIETRTADFTKDELAKHDLINIISAAGASSYRIDSISSTKIITDSGQPKLSTLNTPQFLVYKNSVSFDSLSFDEVSSHPAHALVDIFMDKDRNIFSKKRMVYEAPYDLGDRARFAISDFSGDLSEDAELEISIDPITSSVLFSLDGGRIERLSIGKRIYKDIFSGISNLKIRLYIDDVSDFYSYIDSLTSDSTSVSIVGAPEASMEENLFLGRLLVESGNGRITGAGSTTPRVFSRVERGLSGAKDLGSSAISKVLEAPISEMRSNGVIRGVELSTAASGAIEGGKYVIDISSGVCYVKGTRFEILEKISLKTEIENSGALGGDKIFVAINEWGEVVFALADAITCASPFDSGEFCALGSIEWSDPDATAYDLRLFINDLDLKLLNSITVSPQPGMGHFSSINKAIKYAKRFSDLFPFAGVPTVHLKSGTHIVSVDTGLPAVGADTADLIPSVARDGIYINFPLNITGEGESTVLDITNSYSDTEADKIISQERHGAIFLAGPGVSDSAPAAHQGIGAGFVSLSDFTLKLSKVFVIDPAIKDSDNNNINWGARFSGIIFDYSSYLSPQSGGIRVLGVDLDPSMSSEDCFGNISIKGCQFLNSYISIDPDASLCQNINILNNTFRGSGDGAYPGAGNIAIFQDGPRSIFGFDECPPGNNVQIFGNINADNNGSDFCAMDPEDQYAWGDRISRHLSIGGDLSAGGDLSLAGAIIEGSIMINDPAGSYLGLKALDVGGGESPDSLLSGNITCYVLKAEEEVIASEIFATNYVWTPTLRSGALRVSLVDDNEGIPAGENIKIGYDHNGDGYIDLGDYSPVSDSVSKANTIWAENIHLDDTLYANSSEIESMEVKNLTITGAVVTDLAVDLDVRADGEIYCADIHTNGGNESSFDWDVYIDNDLQVAGVLSKGSGTFKIRHPLVEMSETHDLVHSFIEGPRADLIYRGVVDLVMGSASIDIDAEFGMENGTFNSLCDFVQCFTSNESGWTPVRGSVNMGVLTIVAKSDDCTDEISWMVIGDRKDPHIIAASWTDERGKPILEPKRKDRKSKKGRE